MRRAAVASRVWRSYRAFHAHPEHYLHLLSAIATFAPIGILTEIHLVHYASAGLVVVTFVFHVAKVEV